MVSFFQTGYGHTLHAAGLFKTAARAMDKYFSVTPEPAYGPDDPGGRWIARFKGEEIGGMTVHPETGQVSVSGMTDPRFKGMGLGKKMYGQVMRQMPGATLLSDEFLSPFSSRVYERMRADPSYETWKHPGIKPGGYNVARQQATAAVYGEAEEARRAAEAAGTLTEEPHEFEQRYVRERLPAIREQYAWPKNVEELPATPENVRRYGATTPTMTPQGELAAIRPAYAVSLPEAAQIRPTEASPAWLQEAFEQIPFEEHYVGETLRQEGAGELAESLTRPERRVMQAAFQELPADEFPRRAVEEFGRATDVPTAPTPKGALTPQQIQGAAEEAPGVNPALWERVKKHKVWKREAAMPGRKALMELAYPGAAVAGAAKPSSFVSRLRGLVT